MTRLRTQLQADSVSIWPDAERPVPAADEQVETAEAVRKADVLLVCLSAESLDREGNLKKEIELALDTAVAQPKGAILIVPARLEDCVVPARLSGYRPVDLFESNGYERLLEVLQSRAAEIGALSPRAKARQPFQDAESAEAAEPGMGRALAALKQFWGKDYKKLVFGLELAVGVLASVVGLMTFLTGKDNIRQFFPATPEPIASPLTFPAGLMPAADGLTITVAPDPLPTATITPPAAPATKTATITRTPEPGYTLVDRGEVFSLSPTVKALGELAREQYTSEERNQVNRTLTFTIEAGPDVPMFWRWYWCAASEQILDQNLREMEVIFEADGRLIPPEQLATVKYSYENQDGDTWWCFTYSTVLKDWKPGRYRFIQTTVLKSAIHDGKDLFPAGYKIYEYTVTISR